MDPVTAKMALQLGLSLARHRSIRYLAVGLVITSMCSGLAVVFGPWLVTTQLAATLRAQQQGRAEGGSCDPATPRAVDAGAGSAGSFSAEQVGNARIIWQVGQQMGMGDYGAVVGIATALQESTLRNLSYGDRDSVGLFQQRAGWGSTAVRTNPGASARLFYAALARVPGWRQMPLTRAAQAVQRSAFPTAYAKHEKPASGLVALFRSRAPAGSPQGALAFNTALCGRAGAAVCPGTGLGAENGLTPDARRVLRCVKQRWPQLSGFGGVGDRPANVDRDHQEGRAVDIMIPDYRSAAGRRLGDAVAGWVRANNRRLGVKYVIWNGSIWSVQRGGEGWRACGSSRASCYSGPNDTAAHRDHVHVSVFGDQAAGTDLPAPSGLVVSPLRRYVLTARFGQCSSRWVRCHTGLDFAAGTGTPIRAIMAGRVVWTGWGGPYGNLTKVQHRGGVQSWYAHQSGRGVRVGQNVAAGQVIGRVGGTGNVTGPHLHLEVRLGGTPVDPDRWLSARGVSP